MRTTVDLPDDLYRAIKARAALAGLKVRELMTQYLAEGLRDAEVGDRPEQPTDFPVVIPPLGRRIPSPSAEETEELLDKESKQG